MTKKIAVGRLTLPVKKNVTSSPKEACGFTLWGQLGVMVPYSRWISVEYFCVFKIWPFIHKS